MTLLRSGCGDRPEALRAWLRARDLARRLGDEKSLGRLDLLLAGVGGPAR